VAAGCEPIRTIGDFQLLGIAWPSIQDDSSLLVRFSDSVTV